GTTQPCNPVTGNKFFEETDYSGAGPFPLQLQRFYNSTRPEPVPAAANWRHTYDRSIHAGSVSLVGSETKVARSDGQVLTFSFLGGRWMSDPDVVERLEEQVDASGSRSGWVLTDANDTVEAYDALGRLVSITNRDGFTQTLSYDEISGRLETVRGPFGRTLGFAYDQDGRLATMTDPADNVYRYQHDAAGNLSAVIYPDETSDDSDNPLRTYVYEDPRFPFHVTGIIDENGNRFSNVAYDDQGRAILSEQEGGINRITISYNTDGTSTVTDALGNQTVYEVESVYSVFKTTGLSEPCPLCQNKNAANSYDDKGFPASTTDFNGNLTTFDYDDRGLETSRTEAAGTPESRTIATEWHPTLRRPVKVTEPGRETSFSYDSVGRLLTRTVTDTTTGASRTTTRTYTPDGLPNSPEGLLASIDGPRTDAADITRFEYDEAGNLTKTTNALNHETLVTDHDPHGRPLTIVDPNDAVTELRYDVRGRLTSRALIIRESDGNLSRFETRFEY
ncbi:MAG: DUF6531 domain-containing protein, partial [Rhodothermales bacterium]|nr:DUF6531 domain-containing protein [Rhodothermales bacterium]